MFSALRAEKRAPKKGVVEAENLAQGDMPVAFHGANIGPHREPVKTRTIGGNPLIGQRFSPVAPAARHSIWPAIVSAILSGGVCGGKSFRYSPSGPIRKTMEEWSIVYSPDELSSATLR